jgi:hypothetical protein
MNLRNLVAYNALQKQHNNALQTAAPSPPPPQQYKSRPQQQQQQQQPQQKQKKQQQKQQQRQQQPQRQDSVKRTVAAVAPAAFFCTPCSKAFKTKEMFEIHVEDHEECSHLGCGFSACEGVMKEHRLVHTQRVQNWMKMTSEEIEEWRDQRRRNWPTAENVKRKREEEEKRMDEEQQKRSKRDEQQDQQQQYNQHHHQQSARKNERRHGAVKEGKQKRAKPVRPNLLRNLFSAERNVEADLLIQCFEHWIEASKEEAKRKDNDV